MKKITLAVLALFIALPLIAGDADNASVVLTGSATTTFGVDLDSGATGFQNSVDAKIEFRLGYANTSVSRDGMDMAPIYGEIVLDEIYMDSVASGDSTTVYWDVDVAVDHARIHGPGWWISLTGPDNSIDMEDSIRDAHIDIVGGYGSGMNALAYAQTSSGGIQGQYTIEGVGTIQASLFSLTDWTDTGDDKNAYGASTIVNITAVDGLTLQVGAGMAFGTGDSTTLNDDMTVGAKAGYKVSLSDTMYIEPVIGFDLHMLTDDMEFAIGNGLTIGIGGSTIAVSDGRLKYRSSGDTLTEVAFEDDTAAGIAVMWDYYQPPADADAVLDIYAEAGISVIENLQIAAGFAINDMTADVSDMGMAAYGRYDLSDSIYVDGGLFMKFDNTADGGSQAGLTAVDARFAWTDFIPYTDLTIDWYSGDLALDEADLGLLKVAVSIAY